MVRQSLHIRVVIWQYVYLFIYKYGLYYEPRFVFYENSLYVTSSPLEWESIERFPWRLQTFWWSCGDKLNCFCPNTFVAKNSSFFENQGLVQGEVAMCISLESMFFVPCSQKSTMSFWKMKWNEIEIEMNWNEIEIEMKFAYHVFRSMSLFSVKTL